MTIIKEEKIFFILNGIISISAFSFLTWLIYFYQNPSDKGLLTNSSFLPAINATLNSAASICLVMGYLGVRTGKINFHKTMMIMAFVFSSLFLLCYIYYHQSHGNTPFEAQGWVRPIYFFILISHIVLSGLVFPMILTTFYFALTKKIDRHKKIAKFTLPLWMYVSVTGVMIFFFLKWLNP